MISRLLDWIAKKRGYARVYYENGRVVFDGRGMSVDIPSEWKYQLFLNQVLERHEIRNLHYRYSTKLETNDKNDGILYNGGCIY